MTLRRSLASRDWANLIIGSGLAASIAALGSFGTGLIDKSRDSESKRCEIAAGLLQDEAPSPYIDKGVQLQLGDLAAKRFKRCMED